MFAHDIYADTLKQKAMGWAQLSIASTSEVRVPLKHLNTSLYGSETMWQMEVFLLKDCAVGPEVALLGNQNVISGNCKFITQ